MHDEWRSYKYYAMHAVLKNIECSRSLKYYVYILCFRTVIHSADLNNHPKHGNNTD